MKYYDLRLLLIALAGVTVLATPATALVCGDSEPSIGEQCDDGNTVSGDGCDATCLVEAGSDCTDAIPASAGKAFAGLSAPLGRSHGRPLASERTKIGEDQARSRFSDRQSSVVGVRSSA